MLVFILFIIIWAITDGWEDAWYNTINHWRAVIRRCATAVLVVYAYCGVGSDWILYINTGIMTGLLFLIAFNIARNLASGEDWHYFGETSSWDKFFRKFNYKIVWGCFFFLTAVSIVVQYYHAEFSVHAQRLINVTWLF
jgi:hypothetical protein